MPLKYDQKTLVQVEALYGIDENAAITRLAKEYDANVQARYIEERHLPGYAGAWFDPDTQGLVVATNDSSDFAAIKHVGATPTLVAHSLAQLNAARARAVEELESGSLSGSMQSAWIDVKANTVRLGIVDTSVSQVSNLIGTLHLDAPVRVVSVPPSDVGFSSDLRGADRTRNSSWSIGGGLYSPCSVGASAEVVNGTTYTAERRHDHAI